MLLSALKRAFSVSAFQHFRILPVGPFSVSETGLCPLTSDDATADDTDDADVSHKRTQMAQKVVNQFSAFRKLSSAL